MRLLGKAGIITGASSGIGEAGARLFVEEGGNVVLCARREDRLTALAEELGPHAIVLADDVADEATHQALVTRCISAFGRLDFAFNNAGTVGPGVPLPDTSTDDWNVVIATNLTSAYFAAKYQMPLMLEAGRGSIVFTSSFVGHTVGLPGMGAYAAPKRALSV